MESFPNTETETPVVKFAIGIAPPIKKYKGESLRQATWRHKWEQDKRRREEKRRKLKKLRKTVGPVPRYVSWFLLPAHACGKYYFSALLTPGYYYWNRMENLEKLRISLKETPLTKDLLPFMKEQSRLMTQTRKKVKELYNKNNTIRWIFKRFITRWRLRRMKDANHDDPITLSPIEQPVYLYSYPSKRRYIYEAEMLAKELHKKLLNNDGQFPTPISPRNILTNEDLHLGQMISLVQQCKSYGKTHWTLESFSRCGYNIVTFLQYERKQLRMHALNTVFHDPTLRWEYNDIMESFMEGQHEQHNKRFSSNLYRWLLKFIPTDPLLQSWESACKKWYRADILTDDPVERVLRFDCIEESTKELCVVERVLVQKRARFLRTYKK